MNEGGYFISVKRTNEGRLFLSLSIRTTTNEDSSVDKSINYLLL